MVRKVQNSKSTKAKPSAGAKNNQSSKTQEEGKLSNGFTDSEKVVPKTVTEQQPEEASEPVENMDGVESASNEEVVSDTAKPEAAENKSGDEEEKPRKSRKRQATVNTKDKKSTKATKAKKQKILIEVPKIKSISGKVFVIGNNEVGQLGLEDLDEKKKPAPLELPYSIVDIAAGGMHSVCLTEKGEVITFGCNDEGALGRITSEDTEEVTPRPVDISERIVQISAGDSHSAALSESGQVYVWGNFRNRDGQMGLATAGTKQPTPVRILNSVKVVNIRSGGDHLVCLSQEGEAFSCGDAQSGQLGRVSEHASVDGGRKGMSLLLVPEKVPVAKSNTACTINNIWTGSYSTFFNVQENNSVYACGLNNYSQLGLTGPETFFKPKQLSAFSNKTWSHINGGQHHTLALDNAGLVYSLGRSEYGRLGLGENCEVTSVPTVIPVLEDKKCVDISCGDSVSFAITDNGSIYSWGLGTNYQLGHGSENDQHIPKLIEGNFFNSWKAIKISGGGQHTLILAQPKRSSEENQ